VTFMLLMSEKIRRWNRPAFVTASVIAASYRAAAGAAAIVVLVSCVGLHCGPRTH